VTDPVEILCEAGRRLASSGVCHGSSGNVSLRDDDRMFITATGADLGRLTSYEVSEVGLDGTHRDGPAPSKEVAVHRAMYARESTHRAVVHVHSPHAVAVSCLPPWSETSALPPLTPYFLMRVGQVPLLPYRAPGDPELGAVVGEHPRGFRAALLANHGPVAGGRTMDEAIAAALEVEETSRVALLVHDRGPRVLADDAIAALTTRSGTVWDPRTGTAG
jgi:3-dehydro-4-phosphotetronate decarboxylase